MQEIKKATIEKIKKMGTSWRIFGEGGFEGKDEIHRVKREGGIIVEKMRKDIL